MKSETSHKIKHRETPNDKFYTPEKLAIQLIGIIAKITNSSIPITEILDPCKGDGSFYMGHEYFEIDEGKDFFTCEKKYNWLISNPPYSILDKWLEKSCDVATDGIAYLLAAHALTPKRMEYMESQGFHIAHIHVCKVFKWYGMSNFVVWVKSDKRILVNYTYDRTVWR